MLATQGWRSALGCVSGRLAPPFLVGLATSIQHPVYLHAGICLSCLILAHYSCRSRSPVCSKARDATPDFDYAPLYDPLLSQRELPTFAESFWDSVAYCVDLLRFTEYRHTLRLFTVKAATGGALKAPAAELVWLVHGPIRHVLGLPSRFRTGWAWRPEA